MKLTYEQLATHFSQSTLLPIYLVIGNEILLVEESRHLIYQQAKQQGFNETLKLEINAQFDWDQFIITLQSRSLLSDKRLIELHFTTDKLNQNAILALTKYMDQLDNDICLVIAIPKLENKSKQAKWYQAIDKVGAILTIWPIERQQLPTWIKNRLAKLVITAEPQALLFLANCTEGNLLAAQQEIDKLHLLYGSGHLSLEQVEHALSDHAQYTIFTLADTLLLAEGDKIIKVLQRLKDQGVEPVLILWALAKELRLIARLQFENNTQSLEYLFKKYQIWPKRQSILKQALAKLSYKATLKFLQRATAIDHIIKGIEAGDSWHELSQLCLKITMQLKARGCS